MRTVGYVLLVCALALAIYALNMDTSVRVPYPDGNSFGLPEKVNNLGLMNEQQNLLIFSGILVFLGAIMFFFPNDESGKKDETTNSSVAKATSSSNNIPNEKKYDNLEKIGNLFEKGLLSKEEFEIEKKNILSDALSYEKKRDIEEPNAEVKEIVSNLIELIEKEKNKDSWGKSYRREITDYLDLSCTTKERSILIIEIYQSTSNSNLIEDLKKISLRSNSVKDTLAVFIEFGIIEEEYPHEMINKVVN